MASRLKRENLRGQGFLLMVIYTKKIGSSYMKVQVRFQEIFEDRRAIPLGS